jgi:hypothetical protein
MVSIPCGHLTLQVYSLYSEYLTDSRQIRVLSGEDLSEAGMKLENKEAAQFSIELINFPVEGANSYLNSLRKGRVF